MEEMARVLDLPISMLQSPEGTALLNVIPLLNTPHHSHDNEESDRLAVALYKYETFTTTMRNDATGVVSSITMADEISTNYEMEDYLSFLLERPRVFGPF